jgi:hypothetical protein
MNKKIIAGAMCLLTALLFTSCSCTCGNTVETMPPKTYEIETGIDISEYADFVTSDQWVDPDSDNTFVFNNDGTYEGTIDGKEYKGGFSLNVKDDDGTINVIAEPEGETEEVTYTIKFKTSTDMTLTISDDVSAHFVAKWTTEE